MWYMVDGQIISVPEDSAALPFEFSFRANTPQLLRVGAQSPSCGRDDCFLKGSILLDGSLYREIDTEEMTTGDTNFNNNEVGPLFDLSAWGDYQDINLSYYIDRFHDAGTVEYLTPNGWEELSYEEADVPFEVQLIVQPGFVAELKIHSTQPTRQIMHPMILTRRDSILIQDRILVPFQESQGLAQVSMKLPINGY